MDGRDNPAREAADRAEALSAAVGSRDDPLASRATLRIPPFITQHRRGMNDRWPLQDFLELGARLSAVPCARLHARQVLREWGTGSLSDSTELLVSELVTNAVRASREMTWVCAVRLWLLSDSARILILVWDASPQPPVLTEVTGEAEHGRGLRIVDAVSEQWGWYASGNGKFVWAIVTLCIPVKSHLAAMIASTGLAFARRGSRVSLSPVPHGQFHAEGTTAHRDTFRVSGSPDHGSGTPVAELAGGHEPQARAARIAGIGAVCGVARYGEGDGRETMSWQTW